MFGLYIDGERQEAELYDGDHRIQIEGPGAEGMRPDCPECGACLDEWLPELGEGGHTQAECPECKTVVPIGLDWLFNSAHIHMNENGSEMRVGISVGDPRGAFVWTVRRWNGDGLLIHGPHPSEGLPHMATKQVRPGTLQTCEYEPQKHSRYTIEAGRGIQCDGLTLVNLQRNESIRVSEDGRSERSERGHPVLVCNPERADELARRIVDLLNEYGE